MEFEINLFFLIKLFRYMTKKSRQNFNILRTKRAFEVKSKAFFIFKGFSFAKNCLTPESAFLIAPLVFTRLLLDEIYHLVKLLIDWLMMWS